MVARAVLALALFPAVAHAADPPAARLEDVLAEAGRYVSRLEEELAVLVADETYAQSLFIGRDSSPRHRRSLASDVAWVPTGDGMVWAFFRDVRDVDGARVRDRDARLERLFPAGSTPAGREHAQQILEESSRYNVGRRRTINSPTVASRLEMSPPGLGPVSIETVYGPDDRMGFWLPREMREAYGNRSRLSSWIGRRQDGGSSLVAVILYVWTSKSKCKIHLR